MRIGPASRTERRSTVPSASSIVIFRATLALRLHLGRRRSGTALAARRTVARRVALDQLVGVDVAAEAVEGFERLADVIALLARDRLDDRRHDEEHALGGFAAALIGPEEHADDRDLAQAGEAALRLLLGPRFDAAHHQRLPGLHVRDRFELRAPPAGRPAGGRRLGELREIGLELDLDAAALRVVARRHAQHAPVLDPRELGAEAGRGDDVDLAAARELRRGAVGRHQHRLAAQACPSVALREVDAREDLVDELERALGELGHARREVELEAGEPAVELAADRGGEADSDLVRVALVELDEVEVEADRLPLVDAAGPGVLRARGPHADAVTHLPAVRV